MTNRENTRDAAFLILVFLGLLTVLVMPAHSQDRDFSHVKKNGQEVLIPNFPIEGAIIQNSTGLQITPVFLSDPWCDIRSYAAKCDGATDDTTAVQSAITACKAIGLPVRIPQSVSGCVVTGQLDLSNTQNAGIIGGGLTSGVSNSGNMSRLKYTGTATPFINYGGSIGFHLENTFIQYTTPRFTGVLVEGLSAVATSSAVFRRNYFGSTSGGPNTATVCLSLDTVISSTVDGNLFHNCAIGIQGAVNSTSFSNAIHVVHNNFSSSSPNGDISDSMIKNPTQQWEIDSNTFEMGNALNSTFHIIGFTASTSSPMVSFHDNWIGDCGTGYTGPMIGPFQSSSQWTINSNYVSCGGLTATFVDANSSALINASGNNLANLSVAFANLAGFNHLIASNVTNSVTTFKTGNPASGILCDPLTGTANCGFYGGINNGGTGHKHIRSATTCTTAASVGATCTTASITWPGTAFANTSYTAICSLETPTGVPTISTITKAAGTFTVTIAAMTAVAASYGTVDCIADHD
jgi:hypothetical protein